MWASSAWLRRASEKHPFPDGGRVPLQISRALRKPRRPHPYLDQLAANALRFDRAYTPSPVCVPARQCLATGRYPQRAGCTQFSLRHSAWVAHLCPVVFRARVLHRGLWQAAPPGAGPDAGMAASHRVGNRCALAGALCGTQSDRPPEMARGGRPAQVGARVFFRWASMTTTPCRAPAIFSASHFGGMYDLPAETPLLMMVSLQQPHFPCWPIATFSILPRPRPSLSTSRARSPGADVGRIGQEEGIGKMTSGAPRRRITPWLRKPTSGWVGSFAP